MKLRYVVKSQNQVNIEQNQKKINSGFCPFLRWLRIEEGLTPSVWSHIAQYGAIGGSFEAAHKILIDWGIDISLKRIERLTYQFGKIGINLRNKKLRGLQQGSLSTDKYPERPARCDCCRWRTYTHSDTQKRET